MICANLASGATINAPSCSQAHVQAAVNQAAKGDTVVVPAGSCTWSSPVVMNKGISLIGAGIGKTNIEAPGTGFSISVGTDSLYRLSGFSIDNTRGTGASASVVCGSGPVIINDAIDKRPESSFMQNFRVDNIRVFSDPENTDNNGAICVNGLIFGVFDNIQIQGMGRGWMVQAGYNGDSGFTGDYAWTKPLDPGGKNNVYIEDSTYSCSGNVPNGCQALDGRYGGRVVFRNSRLENGWIGPHAPQSYSPPYGGRGFLYAEIYRNTFTSGSYTNWMSAYLRSGTGIIWNNEVEDADGGSPQFLFESRWACEGSRDFDCQSSYPCIDGFGRGPNQQLTPAYAWDNKLNGAATKPGIHATCQQMYEVIKENREYYNYAKPGWSPYTYPHPLRTGACTPDCAGRQCGPDGCGGSCGSCQAGQSCGADGSCSQPGCVPATEICGNGIDEDCDGFDLPCAGAPTVAVDSTYPGYSSSKIDDGNRDAMGGTSTTWASGESVTEPHWVIFTFPQPKEISDVAIYWAYNNKLQMHMASQQLLVQYWDGARYTTIAEILNTVPTEKSRISFPKTNTGRLRLYQPAGMGPAEYNEVLWLAEVDYGSCLHEADTDCDGCVRHDELMQYISSWKNGQKALAQLMEAIGRWKSGC